jgi:thiamine biosynthesis lipoprotein
MGTGWSLRAVSPPAGVADGVQAALDRVVAQMSQWEPESDLSRFNRAPPGQWRMLPPEFVTVLKAGLDVAAASGGAFDPAMGALSDIWGFGAAPAPLAAPDDTAIAEALAGKGPIELDAAGLRARRMGRARLDFSGIAKGFGVDKAAEWLLARGLRHFLLEVGGELRGEGLKPDGQPWWVDIEAPPGVILAPLRAALHRLAIATSGDYRRWLDVGGRRYGHTLDPRSGRPAENRVRSVTVLHPRCMLADAWATALAVLGPDEGLALAERHGLAVRMVVGGAEHLSPALREMLD